MLMHERAPTSFSAVVHEMMQTTVGSFGNLSNKKEGSLAGGERGVALLNHIVWDC